MAAVASQREQTPRLRVAILGGGMIAGVHRRSAILAGAEITGVLDRSRDTTRALADRWGVSYGFDSIDDVLDSGVDVVHVCTPNATHATYARAALEAGVNVICEKPLGITVGEADELTALAGRSGLVAAVPFVYRFHPLIREIRARRLAGEFGSWHLLHGSYLQDWLLSPSASSWRVSSEIGGASRAFADIGSHWCDLVEWVSGERISELIADMSIAIPARAASLGPTFSTQSSGAAGDVTTHPVTTEDIATVLLRTRSGVPGTLTISQVSAGRKNRLWFELDGSDASAVFDQENPESIWLGGERSSQVILRDPASGSPEQRRLSQLPAGHPQGWAHCFDNFIADAYAAVHGEARDGLPTFADGARAMHLVDAVLRSTRTRAWQKVG